MSIKWHYNGDVTANTNHFWRLHTNTTSLPYRSQCRYSGNWWVALTHRSDLTSCDTQCGQSVILDWIPVGYTDNHIWTDFYPFITLRLVMARFCIYFKKKNIIHCFFILLWYHVTIILLNFVILQKLWFPHCKGFPYPIEAVSLWWRTKRELY